MTVKTMKTLKPLSFLALFAVLVGGLSAPRALAQEYKEAYNAAIEAAKAQDYSTAHDEFARAADLAEQEGDTEIAGRAARNASIIDYNLGRELLDAENFDQALEHFESGIALYPQSSNNYRGKAIALKNLERPEEAIAAYQDLIAHGEETGDSEAVTSGEEAIRDHYTFLASSALGRQTEPSAADAREALGYLDELEELLEPTADTYFYRAAANNALGNYDEAIALANQALEIHRGSRTDAAKIHFVRGEALMYSGDTAAAKEAFQNATFGSYKSLAEHYLETL
jgi:tetratricopeptide (TPR) repeat protein